MAYNQLTQPIQRWGIYIRSSTDARTPLTPATTHARPPATNQLTTCWLLHACTICPAARIARHTTSTTPPAQTDWLAPRYSRSAGRGHTPASGLSLDTHMRHTYVHLCAIHTHMAYCQHYAIDLITIVLSRKKICFVRVYWWVLLLTRLCCREWKHPVGVVCSSGRLQQHHIIKVPNSSVGLLPPANHNIIIGCVSYVEDLSDVRVYFRKHFLNEYLYYTEIPVH